MGLSKAINAITRNVMVEPDYSKPSAGGGGREETSKTQQRWLYCILVGCTLVMLVTIFFGGITWVQLHRRLPRFNVTGGEIIGYRIVDGRPVSTMRFDITCDNDTDQKFKISSARLKLQYIYEGKSYTIATVETEGFRLQERERNRRFLGQVSDAPWEIPNELLSQVEQNLASPQGLQVLLHGRFTTHYSASRVLKNISRQVTVTQSFLLKLRSSG